MAASWLTFHFNFEPLKGLLQGQYKAFALTFWALLVTLTNLPSAQNAHGHGIFDSRGRLLGHRFDSCPESFAGSPLCTFRTVNPWNEMNESIPLQLKLPTVSKMVS